MYQWAPSELSSKMPDTVSVLLDTVLERDVDRVADLEVEVVGRVLVDTITPSSSSARRSRPR